MPHFPGRLHCHGDPCFNVSRMVAIRAEFRTQVDKRPHIVEILAVTDHFLLRLLSLDSLLLPSILVRRAARPLSLGVRPSYVCRQSSFGSIAFAATVAAPYIVRVRDEVRARVL